MSAVAEVAVLPDGRPLSPLPFRFHGADNTLVAANDRVIGLLHYLRDGEYLVRAANEYGDLKHSHETHLQTIATLTETMQSMAGKRELLIEALEFYAARDSWSGDCADDLGHIARAALAAAGSEP